MKKFSLFVAVLVLFSLPARAELINQDAITLSVTPTISSSPAYSANDQVGGVQTLSNAVQSSSSCALLTDIAVIDKDSQKASIDVFFFNALPAPSSVDNGAFTISDADAGKLIGVVNVATASYKASAGQSLGAAALTGVMLCPAKSSLPTASNRAIYAVAVTRGTPTYTSTNRLTFLYKLLRY